jgi:hypothetical protein
VRFNYCRVRPAIEKVLEKASELGFDGIMLMAKRPHVSPLDYDPDEVSTAPPSSLMAAEEMLTMLRYPVRVV